MNPVYERETKKWKQGSVHAQIFLQNDSCKVVKVDFDYRESKKLGYIDVVLTSTHELHASDFEYDVKVAIENEYGRIDNFEIGDKFKYTFDV